MWKTIEQQSEFKYWIILIAIFKKKIEFNLKIESYKILKILEFKFFRNLDDPTIWLFNQSATMK